MNRELVILGVGGHGKVILDMALQCGYRVLGFLDDDKSKEELAGYPILGIIDDAVKFASQAEFIIGIGSNAIRKKLDHKFSGNEFQWGTLIHPKAVIGGGASLGAGTVVMANAVINPFAQVGRHCIVNTAAVVEHDNRLSDYVHISPGAILAGTVDIGMETHIGAGAVVCNNISICENVMVGAGAVVVKNIEKSGVYIGVPAERR